MNTNQKGEIAQLRTQIRATEKGWIVSRTTEGARYDMILDDGDQLYRVQVKYAGSDASHSEGGAVVAFRQTEGDDRNKNSKYCRRKTRKYNASEIDAVIAYLPQIDQLCWLGPEVFADKPAVVLRYQPPKNGQKKGVHMVEDYIW